jgi:hydrogenase-4 component F
VSGLAFNPVAAILVVPALAAVLLALLPGYRLSARVNLGASLLTLVAACSLFVVERPAPGNYLLVDELNIVFIVLNTFVGFTAAVFSASYIGHELETGKLTPANLRFYHSMYQLMMFGMNLALVSNNIGLMWVAVELATLTTVLMVGLYRTHEALEAAWKYFILGSVGIALALFGTILVYMSAQPVLGEGVAAMIWTNLIRKAAEFDPAMLNVAFAFLLLGYGTKVGLAPLHAWLPDAHAEGPTPISAVLSGLLLNVALYAVLRFKMLMAANPETLAPGPLMIAMGLLSVIFAALMLYRRRDIKRMFAYSSIEHMGIIVFAFGMGGPLANFAGLLHMVMHSLTKSAIFFAVGTVAQIKGTQKISEIRGLTQSHPALGWGLALGRAGDRRHAAVRRVHERVPAGDLELCPGAGDGAAAGARPADRLRCAADAAVGLSLRRARRAGGPRRRLAGPALSPHVAGAARGAASARADGRVVPDRRRAAGVMP